MRRFGPISRVAEITGISEQGTIHRIDAFEIGGCEDRTLPTKTSLLDNRITQVGEYQERLDPYISS